MKSFNTSVITTFACTLIFCSTVDAMHDTKQKVKQIISSPYASLQQARSYLCSKEGIKDMLSAYCLGMGLTAIHEFGHAATAKILEGAPINMTLGATPGSSFGRSPYLQVAGIKLAGFNPATGYAQTGYTRNHFNRAAILIAGPLCGALSSFGAHKILQNGRLRLTTLVAAYGLFNNTIGIAGLGGVFVPGSDMAQLVALWKKK